MLEHLKMIRFGHNINERETIMKRIITLLISVVALSMTLVGCIPAALVIGATAGGSFIYSKRDIQTMASDKQAAITASTKIAEDLYLRRQTHILVTVFNRTALLAGQTYSQELKDRAGQIVSSVKNIDRVYNEITIAPPGSITQRSKDMWITTSVKTALLSTKDVESTQIKVVTEQGVVYLMGLVTRTQADLATDVTRHVSGVRKVVKIFQYLS